jgi:UDP-glucose 4-epimerase
MIVDAAWAARFVSIEFFKASMTMNILVTGGMGYIGSHTCVELLNAGHRVTILDNLVNSERSVQQRIEQITGKPVAFVEADIRDRGAVEAAFDAHKVDAVIHFAGLKAVGESVQQPLRYYDNNVTGSIVLFETMARFGVTTLVFSSSATVYGEPLELPIRETHRLAPTNPYGKTKLVIEHLLADFAASDANFRYAALRYFNPTGAHASGRLGEDPNGIPNNLFPYISQVAVGRRSALRVWGSDYPTPDGTGVRDYIHVVDLAEGHVAALAYLERGKSSLTVNLGTGRGYSVLDAAKAFERASGRPIPLEFSTRRPGDVASCFADASLASRELAWQARFDLDAMCRDVWRWQSANPNGYT